MEKNLQDVPQIPHDMPIITSKKGINKTRIAIIVAIATLGLLIVGIIAMVSMGRLVIVLKDSQQKVTLSPLYCGDEVIDKFNSAMDGYYAGSITDASTSESTLDGIVTDFSKLPNYRQDPNCVFIQFRVAVINSDQKVAKVALEQFEKLVKNGKSADGRIEGLMDPQNMKVVLDSIRPADEVIFDE